MDRSIICLLLLSGRLIIIILNRSCWWVNITLGRRETAMKSVLIIDDDKELCALMKKCVAHENLMPLMAYSGLEGLRAADEDVYKRQVQK